jgi:subtilisin family serine protease
MRGIRRVVVVSVTLSVVLAGVGVGAAAPATATTTTRSGSAAGGQGADPTGTTEPVEGVPATIGDGVEVIVLFENDSARSRALSAGVVRSLGNGTVTGGTNVSIAPVAFARMPAASMDALEAHPAVRVVERDAPVRTATQDTPWGVDRTDAREAARVVGSAPQGRVDVAVIDTGVDPDHPDLDVTWGVNTTGQDPLTDPRRTDPSDWADQAGHGTEAAGVVAALNDSAGVVGVSPAVDLYAVKSLQNLEGGTATDLVEGIDEAVKGPDNVRGTADDADVISMSLGTPTDVTSIQTAVENANATGVVLVAAAGNEGDSDPTTNEVIYPAKYEEAIAVAAVQRDERVASYSASGAEVELSGPTSVQTTARGGGYGGFGGTSAATPHAAGAAALSLARASDPDDEDATVGEAETVRTRLRTTAEELAAQRGTRDTEYGFGLVDAAQVVRASDGTTGGDLTIVPGGVGATGIDPTVVRGNGTTTQTLTLGLRNLSADDHPDRVVVTLPNTTAVAGPVRATVESSDGRPVPVVNDPNATVRNATGGTDNRLTVAVSPDRAVDTVDATVTLSLEVAHADVEGNRRGSVTVAATDSEGNDSDGAVVATYTVVDSAFTEPLPLATAAGVPTDPDGDGVHEDVDGDLEVTFADVVALFDVLDSTRVRSAPEAFDFNGNGAADFDDLVRLYRAV